MTNANRFPSCSDQLSVARAVMNHTFDPIRQRDYFFFFYRIQAFLRQRRSTMISRSPLPNNRRRGSKKSSPIETTERCARVTPPARTSGVAEAYRRKNRLSSAPARRCKPWRTIPPSTFRFHVLASRDFGETGRPGEHAPSRCSLPDASSGMVP